MRRLHVCVELENFRSGPHIHAVVIHKNGDIAQDAHALSGAVAAQFVPLLVKRKLQRLLNRQTLAIFSLQA